MKKKYQNIILDSVNLIGKIPCVKETVMDISVYISACRDYQEACKCLTYITYNIQIIDGLEKELKDMDKNECEYEFKEMKEQISWYSNQMENIYKELKQYISERQKKRWA